MLCLFILSGKCKVEWVVASMFILHDWVFCTGLCVCVVCVSVCSLIYASRLKIIQIYIIFFFIDQVKLGLKHYKKRKRNVPTSSFVILTLVVGSICAHGGYKTGMVARELREHSLVSSLAKNLELL